MHFQKPQICVKKPVLGLVPTGKETRLIFRLENGHEKPHFLRIKPRADGPVKISRPVMYVNSSKADEITVIQNHPELMPSQKVLLDYYFYAGPDLCRRAERSEFSAHGMVPHLPGCKHYAGTLTLRYSRRLAIALAWITPLLLMIRTLKQSAAERLVACVQAIRLLGKQTNHGLNQTRLSLESLASDTILKTRLGWSSNRNRLRRDFCRALPQLKQYATVACLIMVILGLGTLFLLNLPDLTSLKYASAKGQVDEVVPLPKMTADEPEAFTLTDEMPQACLPPQAPITPAETRKSIDCRQATLVKTDHGWVLRSCIINK